MIELNAIDDGEVYDHDRAFEYKLVTSNTTKAGSSFLFIAFSSQRKSE
jgi:hypothetical protein